MPKKKLKIRTRRKPEPPLTIKKRKPKIKKKKVTHCCSYCLHWWAGPRVSREGDIKVRLSRIANKSREENHRGVCSDYNGDWVVVRKVNCVLIRDSKSPPEIKVRKKKEEEKSPDKFIIQRRVIDDSED